MIGSVAISIRDKRNSYHFELKRNITILCGESGKGKTTLFEMISDYNRFGKASGIKVSCNKDILAITGENWEEKIVNAKDSIIVIDEDNEFIKTKEFAKVVQNSDNYYLLITRSYIPTLPVSVTEIYELSGNKTKKFVPYYSHIEYLYNKPVKKNLPFVPEVLIIEDSKTGYDFFNSLAKLYNIDCVSAKGNSNIIKLLSQYSDQNVLVIGDGAAFGSEMKELVLKQTYFPRKIGIFLPESFEWLILKSGLVNDIETDVLENTGNYVDSGKYLSWERYFTDLLVETTKSVKYMKYPKNKSKLPEFYTREESISKVMEITSSIAFKK